MYMHSRYIINMYRRLLADIRDSIGESLLGTPDDSAIEWIIINGPQLDKDILGLLDDKSGVEPTFPQWLSPLWEHFCLTQKGSLLKYLRQILVFGYKAEQKPTHDQLKDAQATFEETDGTVGVWNSCFNSRNPDPCFTAARRIVGSVIYRIDWLEIVPKHGPGGIFPSRLPCDKSLFETYYTSIARWYPYDKYFWSLPSYWVDIMVRCDRAIKQEDDIVAKLTAVPKDSRGPRLICVHPAEAIWVQQGKRQKLEHAIESHPLTKGRINFTDQTVNSNLALISSSDRYYATLDLKEASDRVGIELVRFLFGDYAYDIMSCSRANKIQLLDGRVMKLEKWAPMGNCLTFPVQSLIFFSLVVAGIRMRYGVNCSDVYVFGDDIVFPVKYYDGVVESLIKAGLVPNFSKTFYKGFFRESCGVDAFKGVDVTPHRIRKHAIERLDAIESQLALALQLRLDGYYGVSEFIYKSVRRVLKIRYNTVLPYSNNPEHGGLFEYMDTATSRIITMTPYKFCRKRHVLLLRTLSLRAVVKTVRKGCWYNLADSLWRLERMSQTHGDRRLGLSDISDRPTEYPVPYRTRLQYGWTLAH